MVTWRNFEDMTLYDILNEHETSAEELEESKEKILRLEEEAEALQYKVKELENEIEAKGTH